MTEPQFNVEDKVVHRSASTLGVGTVLSVRERSAAFESGQISIGGWWYDVRFADTIEAMNGVIEERFAERVLRISVLDMLAGA